LFNKAVGETAELYYQYQYDYIFNSDKFEQAFGVKSTLYADGVQQLAQTVFRPA